MMSARAYSHIPHHALEPNGGVVVADDDVHDGIHQERDCVAVSGAPPARRASANRK
jgi:hypothetical protein